MRVGAKSLRRGGDERGSGCPHVFQAAVWSLFFVLLLQWTSISTVRRVTTHSRARDCRAQDELLRVREPRSLCDQDDGRPLLRVVLRVLATVRARRVGLGNHGAAAPSMHRSTSAKRPVRGVWTQCAGGTYLGRRGCVTVCGRPGARNRVPRRTPCVCRQSLLLRQARNSV